MKLRNELILIAILAAVAGCSTAPKNEVLRSIPEYGDLPTCDVSARLYVRGAQNVSRIVSGLSKDLRDCGYPVCSDADFSAAHPVIPDFVIDFAIYSQYLRIIKGAEVFGFTTEVYTREEERKFERYREAERMLDKMSLYL